MHTTHRPESTRRTFLKSTLAAGAAASAANLTLSSGVFAGGSDTLKVGLIGCGGRGTGAAEDALRADKNVKLTALCDVFPDRLKGSLGRLEKIFGDKVDVPPERQFSDFDGYQKLINSDVDVVLLATPPQFRPLHAEAVVKAGKHCFFEKPVAVDATGVRKFIQIAHEAQKKNICFMSGFCYRYDFGKRETIKRIHDGAIGDVLAMQINYVTGPIWHRGGDVKKQDMEYQMRNWYYYTWLSGDFIVEQHVHNMDKTAWVLKGEMPAHATALGGRQVRTDPKYGNVYDHFSVVFEYASGPKVFSYCRQMPKCKYNEVSDHVIGSKGAAQLMDHTIRSGSSSWAYEGKSPSMYQQEHDELFAAIRAGKIINDGVGAANASMMAIMGRMAAYSGQRLSWEEALGSKEDLTPKTGFHWGPLDVAPIALPGVTRVV